MTTPSDATIGEIRAFAFAFAPDGWQLCDGSLLSVQANPALFAVLGTAYGGDGVTSFAIPDLRGRTAMGTDPPDHVVGDGTPLPPDEAPPPEPGGLTPPRLGLFIAVAAPP